MTLIRSAGDNSTAKISNRSTRYLSLPFLRAGYGILLAMGAPLGWIALQYLVGRAPFSEAYFDPLLYFYMTVATAVVFSILGYVIGRRESLITDMALTDGLTALYNKRYYKTRLEQEFNRLQRHGTRMAVVQVDLDHFKLVNDTWGHQAGDEVLKNVASVIMANCRRNEIAARVGGEEISIIASDSGLEEAEKLANRLKAALDKTTSSWQGEAIRVTASFGVAEAHAKMENAWVVFQQADKALYQAKQNGRDQVVCYRDVGIGREV